METTEFNKEKTSGCRAAEAPVVAAVAPPPLEAEVALVVEAEADRGVV